MSETEPICSDLTTHHLLELYKQNLQVDFIHKMLFEMVDRSDIEVGAKTTIVQ